jgi:hypothetical protein
MAHVNDAPWSGVGYPCPCLQGMFDTDEAEESGAIALAGDPHAAGHAAAAQRGPPDTGAPGLKRKASDDNGGASAAAPRPGAAVPKKGPAAKRSKHEDQSREKKRMLDEYLAMIKQVLLSTDTNWEWSKMECPCFQSLL